MPHTGISLPVYLLIALLPIAAFLFIEMLARWRELQSWAKLAAQGLAALAFSLAYASLVDAIGVGLVLALLGSLLLYRGWTIRGEARRRAEAV